MADTQTSYLQFRNQIWPNTQIDYLECVTTVESRTQINSLECHTRAVPEIFFNDDFSSGNLDKWASIGAGWAIVNNRLQSPANINSTITADLYMVTPEFVYTCLVNADLSSGDAVVNFLLESNSDYPIILNLQLSKSTNQILSTVSESTGVIDGVIEGDIQIEIVRSLDTYGYPIYSFFVNGNNVGSIYGFTTIDHLGLNSNDIVQFDNVLMEVPVLTFSELSCTTVLRPNTVIDHLECKSRTIQNTFNDSLECKTNLVSGALVHTSFAGAVLPSNVILNQNLSYYQRINIVRDVPWADWFWNASAVVDNINHRLHLTSNYPWDGGNVQLNNLNILNENGFKLSFTLGNYPAIFDVNWNHRTAVNGFRDYWGLQWFSGNLYLYHCYFVSGGLGYKLEKIATIPMAAADLNGRFVIKLFEHKLNVTKNNVPIFVDIPMADSLSDNNIYITGISGYNVSDDFWIDDLDVHQAPVANLLSCKSNIRPNHVINKLECKTHLISNTQANELECKTRIQYDIFKETFDGTVIDSHLYQYRQNMWNGVNGLDTVLHKLRFVGETIYLNSGIYSGSDLDLSSKGFNANFDIDLYNAVELNAIQIVFNSYTNPDDVNIDNIQYALLIDKQNNNISLKKYLPKVTWPPSTDVIHLVDIPFTGSTGGNYSLQVTPAGKLDLWINNQHILSNVDIQDTMKGNWIAWDVNTPGTAWMDNLIVNPATVTSILNCKTKVKAKHWINILECKCNIGREYIEEITLQGSIFADSPMLPASMSDKLIYMEVNGVIFPNMINWSDDTRGNDQSTTFSITYRSPEDLLIFSGQTIRLIELHGDPNGFFTGVIGKITESDKTGERVFTIIGTNTGNTLVTQGFNISAVANNPPSFTSEQWVNMIMFGTDVPLGPCCNYHVGNIAVANDLYNGFAGNWPTKAKALTELMALISKLRGQNISWFVDMKGLLRIYYTDIQSSDVGITIKRDNPRIRLFEFDEDGQGIINSQRGTGGTDNQFSNEMHDTLSQNGFEDADNGLYYPGFGFMPGSPIQDSSVTNMGDLNKKLQSVLDIHSQRIITVNIEFSKFPDCEIGQPIYIPDHYKCKGKTLVITQKTQTGTTSLRTTTIVANNDKTVLGPLSEYESIKAAARHAQSETAPYYGDVVEVGDGIVTVKPVDDIANVNTKDLSKQG